jgi:uncharacterized protein YbaR (Trm112 family)
MPANICKEKRRTCVITPVQYQAHNNLFKKQNIQNAVNVLAPLAPKSTGEELEKIKLVDKLIALNYKAADQKIAQLIQPFQKKWEDVYQSLIDARKEQKQKIMEHPEGRKRVIRLSCYLQKTHLKQLRSQFPLLPVENLEMVLKQERNPQKLKKMLDSRQILKDKLVPDMTVNKEEEEEAFKGCLICYDEKNLVVFSVCGHESCCKDCASKLIYCPLCRTPLQQQKSATNCIYNSESCSAAIVDHS